MINLNGKEFGGTIIFNGGNAGKVENVTISIEKKQPGEPDVYPDFKLVVEDAAGGKLNQGFYYFTPNPQNDAARNEQRETQEISRVLHIAKAVVGENYDFPAVQSAREAFDVLFKIAADNAAGKKFNVFATYGTVNRPNKKGYLGLRYFNFIEPADANPSRLVAGRQDLMERVVEDAPQGQPSTATQNTENWI